MSKIVALFAYWAEHPPVHLMAAGFLGYKPKRKATASDMRKIMQQISPGGKSRGAKSVDRAPLYIQRMIADAKKAKKEKHG